jgi:hypothetical protein
MRRFLSGVAAPADPATSGAELPPAQFTKSMKRVSVTHGKKSASRVGSRRKAVLEHGGDEIYSGESKRAGWQSNAGYDLV